MKLPDSLRDQLKIPLGTLLPEIEANKFNILKLLQKVSYIVTVGDRTTEKLISFGLIPSLQIIDNYEKRLKRKSQNSNYVYTELECTNPAAEITLQSIETIKKAFASKTPIRLTVIGEEDLLVLPVCVHAPENTIVLYGQPNEGLVIVNVTPEIRNKTQSLLDLMK